MKREICATALLLLLIAASPLNLNHVENLTDELLLLLSQSESALEKQDNQLALEYWSKAFELWENSYSYTHIFIRHQEIDSTAGDFYSLKETILQGEAKSAAAAYGQLSYRLECIALMEKPSLGSVF